MIHPHKWRNFDIGYFFSISYVFYPLFLFILLISFVYFIIWSITKHSFMIIFYKIEYNCKNYWYCSTVGDFSAFIAFMTCLVGLNPVGPDDIPGPAPLYLFQFLLLVLRLLWWKPQLRQPWLTRFVVVQTKKLSFIT